MYAPRPSSKVPTFRACSALNRTTRSSCLRVTTLYRDSGSQFNLSNVLDGSTSREKCAHALQSGRLLTFAARNAFGTNFGSADDRYPRRTNLRESMHTAKVGNYAKCQREIADLVVAFYARIMQQECNKTGALINKYT